MVTIIVFIIYILFCFCLGFFFFYGLLTFIEDKKKEYLKKDLIIKCLEFDIRILQHENRMLIEKNKKSYFQGLNNSKKKE